MEQLRMAASLFWITSVLMACMTFTQFNCESIHSKTRDNNPSKMVEIVELMLSQRSNDSLKREFGIQKVPQEGGAPSYEILLTSNTNLQDAKGSQKIKIFVEAENYNSPTDKKNSESQGKQNVFDVLPLSIETVGLNIDHYQRSDAPNGQSEEDFSHKDFESYPSKRQTNWGSRPTSNRQADIKEVLIQREPSYVDQTNPYQPVALPKQEERHRTPTYDGNYSSSSQNGKRVSQTSYGSSIDEHVRSQSRPTPKRNYETSYDENRQTERRTPIREPETVYEDEYRPSRDTSYGRESERRPVYETERRPTYSREPEKPVYSREPENLRPSNDRYPDYETGRPSHSRDPSYIQVPEEPRRPVYEKPSGSDGYRPADSNRPVRDNGPGYSGFPESHQPDVSHHYSRPLQYDPPRVFPVSPCPKVFKYEGREPQEDRWYGDIFVTTDEILTGMRLDIQLDRPAEILTNWIAEAKTKDSQHFTLLSLTHKLMPGPAETVKIMVKFNGKFPVPYVKSISLNGRLICPSNRAQKTTTRRPEYENPGDLHTRRTTTESYQESHNRPGSYVEDYDRTTKNHRRTTPLYEDNRKPTPRPPLDSLRPNPNGYEETDLNSFGGPTKKPSGSSGRPSHSNGKPPAHAAKPSQGGKPNNSGNSQSNAHTQTTSKKSPASNSKPEHTTPNLPNVEKQITCGTPSVQPRPLITHGQMTSRGQWPWHVALYKNVGTDLNFFCGGSLINKNYVLTAAHCVAKAYTTKPLDENTLVVYLGKYHLRLWSEGGVQNRQVSKIYLHPKYNSTDFSSDIAVLALSTPVEYSDYIRPICMWDRSNTKIEDIEGKLGTVVGWGFDETKQLTEELKQAKMPVVEQKTCLWSYPDFYPQFTSNRTYCAGFKNGTSVCNGDSGGGMVFPYKDNSGVERWHLRGIVSISPARNDSRVCDPTHYVVFTDVAKFLPWLDNFL